MSFGESRLGSILRRVYRSLPGRRRTAQPFPGSARYWDDRYAAGGDSGAGSYDFFAEFKAEVLNEFAAEHGLRTVLELGCGDGNQLTLAEYPSYVGFDVSETALHRCRKLFATDPTKTFHSMSDYAGETADLVLSLDVIYHLVEDDIFDQYMRTLFDAALRYVIIYSSDSDDNRGFEGTHVRHRRFTRWIEDHLPGWRLVEHRPNRYEYHGDHRKGSFADFFIYEQS